MKRSPMTLFQFRHGQDEHFGDEAQGEYIFAHFLGGAADGFDRQAGNRNAEMMIILLELFR